MNCITRSRSDKKKPWAHVRYHGMLKCVTSHTIQTFPTLHIAIENTDRYQFPIYTQIGSVQSIEYMKKCHCGSFCSAADGFTAKSQM